MTISQHTTRRGKVIHRLSFHDLADAIQIGGEWRAFCPIHGSDHQRSLAISVEHGWGYCHACHATVFVEDFDPALAERLQRESLPEIAACRSSSSSRAGPPHAEPQVPASQRRPAVASADWQREEVAALTTLAPLMRAALATGGRAQAYLDERGIPPAVATAQGVGYLSRATWEEASLPTAQQTLLTRWIGRVMFPLHSPDGPGFIGRTLARWEPHMDENAHKALLNQPGAPRRWIKTSPAGWFGFAPPERLAEQVTLVEGGFDRLALLAAGFLPTMVIALVGTAARPAWITRLAPQVRTVVLALDADGGGAIAMQRLADEFRRAGLAVTLCSPPQDTWGKDWSERWRRLGPQCAWPLYEALSPSHHASTERR